MSVNTKNFTTKLNAYVKASLRLKDQLHEMICFSLNHAYQHGDCTYVNRIYEVMSPGTQASFKRYVVQCFSDDPTDVSFCWLRLKKKQFQINTEIEKGHRNTWFRAKGKKAVKLSSPAKLINYPSFEDIDPDKVKNPFSDDRVIQTIQHLCKSADKEDAEVSGDMKKLLGKFSKDVEKFAAKRANVDDGAMQGTVH